jgi:hypothetical protein
MLDKEANMIDAYVSAVGVYASAVRALAKLARKHKSGSWDAARVGVNNSRRNTERARLALRAFQHEVRMRKTSGKCPGLRRTPGLAVFIGQSDKNELIKQILE